MERDEIIPLIEAVSNHLSLKIYEKSDDKRSFLWEYQVRLADLLDNAINNGVSGSIVIVGHRGCGKERLVVNMLQNYSTNLIAKINGKYLDSDQQAIIAIAKQLTGNQRNLDYVYSLEALRTQLAGCREQSRPAILVIDEIQEFASKDKQTLIYTLLDLIHDEKLLFLIIGMTSSSNLHSRLEKRVISRLNAQFIVVPRLDLNTLLYEYKRLLILPEFSSDLLDISSFSSSLVSSPEFIRNYSVYRSQFNEIVTRVLAYGDDSDDNHNNNSNNSNNNTLYATPSSVVKEIAKRINWGFSFDHFLRVLQLSFGRFSFSSPYWMEDTFLWALFHHDPPTLLDSLIALSKLELNVFSVVCRLIGQKKSVASASFQSFSHSSKSIPSNKKARLALLAKDVCVEDVVREYSLLFPSIPENQKMQPQELMTLLWSLRQQRLITLQLGEDIPCNDPNSIVETTIVYLIPPLRQVYELYNDRSSHQSSSSNSNSNSNCTSSSSSTFMEKEMSENGIYDSNTPRNTPSHSISLYHRLIYPHEPPKLLIVESIRRAVCQPHLPIHRSTLSTTTFYAGN